ncbi:MAG: DUF4231 domain-containing protein [Phormidesmis sp. RL_2_1]|nr:DUF4231 domain-containing protein [Phormidesmis sp. RL_2_1]
MADNPYPEQIDALDLGSEQKHYLTERWLDQYAWFEKRAGTMQKWYRRLRLIVVVGGVLIPGLIAFRFPENEGTQALLEPEPNGTEMAMVQLVATSPWSWLSDPDEVKNFFVFIISLVVAVAAAIEEFFNFGEKHRNYRKAAEQMKGEYWKFTQLSGPYSKYQTDTADYPTALKSAYLSFVQRIEQIIEDDVSSFITLADEQLAEDNRQIQKTLQETQQAVDKLNHELNRVTLQMQAIAPPLEPETEAQPISEETSGIIAAPPNP